MKLLEQEFYSVSHAVSIGMRKDEWAQEKGKRWEAYLRLSSGSQVVLAREGSKKEVRAYLQQMAGRIGQRIGCAFIEVDGGATLLILDAIVRVYADKEIDGYILLAEDIANQTHTIHRGSKETCDQALIEVANGIMQYQAMKGGGTIGTGREDPDDS